MHGGKVLWLLDPVNASMDSLQTSESTVGVDLDLKLEDQLFKYGLKLNKNLLLDLNAAALGVRTGEAGGRPQIEFSGGIISTFRTSVCHPLVKTSCSKRQFVSGTDTVIREGIKKHLYSKLLDIRVSRQHLH